MACGPTIPDADSDQDTSDTDLVTDTSDTSDPDTSDTDAGPTVVYLTRDTEGRTWPEDLDDEASICPDTFALLGGNGFATACLSAQSATALYPVADVAGRTWPEDLDDEGDLCPSGW